MEKSTSRKTFQNMINFFIPKKKIISTLHVQHKRAQCVHQLLLLNSLYPSQLFPSKVRPKRGSSTKSIEHISPFCSPTSSSPFFSFSWLDFFPKEGEEEGPNKAMRQVVKPNKKICKIRERRAPFNIKQTAESKRTFVRDCWSLEKNAEPMHRLCWRTHEWCGPHFSVCWKFYLKVKEKKDRNKKNPSKKINYFFIIEGYPLKLPSWFCQ